MANNERCYDIVAEELENEPIKPGLWAKAYAEAEGEETKAKAIYIKLRAAQVEQEEKAEKAELQEKARFMADATPDWPALGWGFLLLLLGMMIIGIVASLATSSQ